MQVFGILKYMRLRDKFGKSIELTPERKNHILEFHPDIRLYFNNIRNVLMEPDEIRRSKYDYQVLIFYKYFKRIKKGKYLAVVVKKNRRNFILTSYLTSKILSGEKI